MEKGDRKRAQVHHHRYLPGLDGFRGFAVLAIIIFHLNEKWLTGGFLGVDTFFVISGYLITSLLLSEHQLTGSINLFDFWKRRIKRLIPAVLFLLAIVLTYTIVFEPRFILKIKGDIIAAFFYVSNWWYIFKNVDYFDQFSIQPLKHLWSLAIEEQFYLLYPVALLILLNNVRKKTIAYIMIGISLLSLILMTILTHFGSGDSRVYFGTDTRLQTLLLGGLLAFLWPPFKLKTHIPLQLKFIIDAVGTVSLVFLGFIMFYIDFEDTWLYYGGFYAISLLTILIIASVVHPTGLFAKLMGNPIFVYIGKRSYSLYLWHYPVISYVHTHFVQGQIPFYVYIIDIVLMLLLTEVSYHLVERPIRKQGIKAFSISPWVHKSFSRLALAIVLLIPSVLLFTGEFDARGKAHEENKQTAFHPKKKTSSQPNKNQAKQNNDKNNTSNKDEIKDLSPLLIGDSIMVDIGKEVQNQIPNAEVDGKVGRQLSDVPSLASNNYQSYNADNKQVVLELGTNGDFTKAQLEELLQQFNKADIYLVTTRVPKDYQDHINQLMKQASKDHKNVHLVDWNKISQGHSDYFAYDGIHLEYKGVKRLTKAIQDELLKNE
ncbi:acetyltransferase [Staphylococcus sp. SQ8-PEA]|uniref:Acetyltransferase n=1 Tax=Staphylococcus marylandisciuri TaxID=2981529 RepID=A0ABT2QRT1_9STAP|nr:acyltransferase family protein [Staphylococcus marylandisciuri]MCU5746657.1 acetyltransferase [Staphylococcus marylandisciuri]